MRPGGRGQGSAGALGVHLVPGPGTARVSGRGARQPVPVLVSRAQAGDAEAFAALVASTHAETYTLARRLVTDEDDARDVVQEAYLRAFRSIGAFRGDAQFSTWLYRITANCASSHLGRRRRHRHEPLDDEIDIVESRPDRDPIAAADGRLLRSSVEAALAQLPPKLRAVVVLRDVYDLDHAEIAAELGISESAAKVRLHRARRKLRALVFPTAAAAPVPTEESSARAM